MRRHPKCFLMDGRWIQAFIGLHPSQLVHHGLVSQKGTPTNGCPFGSLGQLSKKGIEPKNRATPVWTARSMGLAHKKRLNRKRFRCLGLTGAPLCFHPLLLPNPENKGFRRNQMLSNHLTKRAAHWTYFLLGFSSSLVASHTRPPANIKVGFIWLVIIGDLLKRKKRWRNGTKPI